MPTRGRRHRRYLAAAAVVLVVLLVSVYLRHMLRAVENAYAVWNVGDVVTVHLDTHEGRWPRDWEDLRPAARLWRGRDNVDTEMARWRERVGVDFSADPRRLAAAPFDPATQVRPFDVVWPLHAPRAHYTEPNVLIWQYLRGETPARYEGATWPATGPATRPTTSAVQP